MKSLIYQLNQAARNGELEVVRVGIREEDGEMFLEIGGDYCKIIAIGSTHVTPSLASPWSETELYATTLTEGEARVARKAAYWFEVPTEKSRPSSGGLSCQEE